MKYIGYIGWAVTLAVLIWFVYQDKPVEKPIQLTNDSTKIMKAKFDSIMNELSLLKKVDGEKFDSLIKLKYADKKNYVHLTPPENIDLRLRLLATLDSSEFKY